MAVAVGVSGMLTLGTGCKSKSTQPALLGQREVVPAPYVEPGSPRTAAMALPVEPAFPSPAAAIETAPLEAIARPAESAIRLPPPVASQPITYTVQKNDTLWDIARMYGVSDKELAAENKIKPGDEKKLKVGAVLRIPPGGHFVPPEKRSKATVQQKAAKPAATKSAKSAPAATATGTTAKSAKMPLPAEGKYTVKSGDSLWKIAHNFGISSDEIRKMNSLTSDVLQVGQVLVLPGSKAEEALQRPLVTGGAAVTPPGFGTPAPAETAPAGGTTAAPAPAPGDTAPATNLDMPNTLEHTVEQAETLESIAEMYGATVDEIKKANPTVKSNADLKLKMKLVVPYK
jgi:LysM repeat protein